MKINITLLSIFLFAGIQLTYAGSATWRADAQNRRWVNSSNWTPATVPNGPADTATFGKSSATVVALSRGSIELDRIEGKIQALAEMAVNRQDPDFLSSQVDSAAESMRQTEKAVSELQHLTGLADELQEPPAILESDLRQLLRHDA